MANTAFYIAKRYLIAKKGSTAVTFITWLSAFAMMTAVASMFIIISVFAGLEDLNREMIANLHADLTISGQVEKKLKDPEAVAKILKQQPEIQHSSKVIEENGGNLEQKNSFFQNPVQILVNAVINSGPREDSTRIGRAGTVRRQAVDVAPLRRVNQVFKFFIIK